MKSAPVDSCWCKLQKEDLFWERLLHPKAFLLAIYQVSATTGGSIFNEGLELAPQVECHKQNVSVQ